MNNVSQNLNAHKSENDYIPALKYNWLTTFYDLVLRWLLRESTFKNQLITQAAIEPGHKALDVGCGTATLTLLAKTRHPEADITGLDGDANILRIAQKKAAKSGLEITLEEGMSFSLSYPPHSFDRVISSLFFHHLTRENKIRTLKEIFRILHPGGELHIADWGKPNNGLMRFAFFFVQLLDGFATTTDNVKGLLPEFIRKAGFGFVLEVTQFQTIFGSLSLYKAKKIV